MTEKRIEIYIVERLQEEQKALTIRVDNIDRSVQGLSREVSGLQSLVKPPAETPAWIRFFVYPSCVIVAAAMVGAVITLLVQVHGIQVFVHDNGGIIVGTRLQQNAADPTNAQNITDTQHALATAKANGIRIPSGVIKSAGERFLEASANNTQTWQTAEQFLNYRSLMNIGLTPSLSELRPSNVPYYEAKTHILTPKGETNTDLERSLTISFSGAVEDFAKSALLEELDHPSKVGSGAKYIVVELTRRDNVIVLDGFYLKNVIIRNSTVAYHGGNVKFENVYFVNCTFDFQLTPRARQLGETMLADVSITFDASAPTIGGL